MQKKYLYGETDGRTSLNLIDYESNFKVGLRPDFLLLQIQSTLSTYHGVGYKYETN